MALLPGGAMGPTADLDRLAWDFVIRIPMFLKNSAVIHLFSKQISDEILGDADRIL